MALTPKSTINLLDRGLRAITKSAALVEDSRVIVARARCLVRDTRNTINLEATRSPRGASVTVLEPRATHRECIIRPEFEKRAFELLGDTAEARGLRDQLSAEVMQQLITAIATDLQLDADISTDASHRCD
jgi:hypothetical protein